MRIWLLVPLQRDLFRRPWKAHWLSTTSYYFHRLRNRWPCTLIFGRTSVAYGFNTPYRLWHAAAGIELSSSRRRKRRVLARPELIFQFFLPRAGFELGTRQRNPKRDYEAAALPLCYLTTIFVELGGGVDDVLVWRCDWWCSWWCCDWADVMSFWIVCPADSRIHSWVGSCCTSLW